jgi:hypothetical protein
MWFKEFSEAVVSDGAGMWKTVHPFADLNVDVVMMDERCKLVLSHDGVRDDGDRDAHVLILLHGRVEIEVLEVNSNEVSIRCGDHAIKEYLDGSEIGGFGANIAIVLDAIAADGETDSTRVRFFGAEGSNNAQRRPNSSLQDSIQRAPSLHSLSSM